MVEKINVTFLGTGSAVPTKTRNHPSILIQYKNENLLFDCGEGTQRQFRYANLNPCKLTRIFISHWHGDHVFGLPGILQTLSLNNYSGKLKIYGPIGTKNFMDLYQKLFLKRGNTYELEVKEIDEGKILDEKEFFIEASKMEHDSPCLAYSFTLKQKNRIDKTKLSKLKISENNPILGELAKGKVIKIDGKKIDGKKFLYTEPSRKITYVTDTKLNQNIISLSKNSDLLICESTYGQDEEKQAREYNHLTSTQSATMAKKSKSKKLALIHLSQRYENPKKILEDAKKIFKNTIVPKDLEKLEL